MFFDHVANGGDVLAIVDALDVVEERGLASVGEPFEEWEYLPIVKLADVVEQATKQGECPALYGGGEVLQLEDAVHGGGGDHHGIGRGEPGGVKVHVEMLARDRVCFFSVETVDNVVRNEELVFGEVNAIAEGEDVTVWFEPWDLGIIGIGQVFGETLERRDARSSCEIEPHARVREAASGERTDIIGDFQMGSPRTRRFAARSGDADHEPFAVAPEA